ncbi:hypothetical protein OOU_Y34scaffold00824g7 [Pyricularia oryzae Y34]|uniref:Uncharacterized protein n=2 Tax=Pyricularia oryzae TaxID=318829 RepID=A0AA97NPL5_PYRO3|nr:hypothetical protein OOU_Y34scaffold00824g7 [Pyricularia oryzae Y34]
MSCNYKVRTKALSGARNYAMPCRQVA